MLKREANLAARDIYIGSTLFHDSRFTRIVPHALALPDGWHPVRPERFPEEGYVFSVDPKVLRKPKGYVVLFTMTRNDRGGRDHFLTTEVDEPFEIADELRDLTPGARRRLLIETGLDRRAQEESRVIVPIGDEEIAFPRLQRSGSGPRWTLSLQEETDRIEVFATPASGLEKFVLDGRAFSLPGRLPTTVVGYVNWQTDAEFLDYLVRKIRKAGQFTSVSDEYRLTDRMLVKLRGFYRDTDAIGERAGVNEAIRDRLAELLGKLSGESTALAQIADALHEHPDVKSALVRLTQEDIDRLRDRETARVRPIIQGEIEAELSSRYAERDALKAETDEVSRRLAIKADELREVEDLTHSGLARLRDGLGAYAGQIRETGETVRRLIAVAGMPISPASERVRKPFPWTFMGKPSGAAVALAALAGLAKERSKLVGLSEDVIARTDILCRAGEIPVLTGDSVEVALSCYAGLVTGGDLTRMPLDPAILGSDDVWRHPASGESTTFGMAWQAALSSPEKYVLACLDDVDRASLSDWFPRFRTLYRASRPSNLLVLATVSAGGEFHGFDDGGLATRIPCDGGSSALIAAVANYGRERPAARQLVPGESHPLTEGDRATLMAKLASVGGGDVGTRLVAIYLAARAWFDHDGASDFVSRTVVSDPGDRMQAKVLASPRVVACN